MNAEKKREVLNRIYKLHSEIADAETFACRRGCATCCTANVTMTTLEAYAMLCHDAETDGSPVSALLSVSPSEQRFRPLVTVNQMAEICMAGETLPEEETNPAAGICPALLNEDCSVYPLRPFGCRCMVSKRACAGTGHAEMDDFLLSVNTVFQQTIEHLDSCGYTGNLADVLGCLSATGGMAGYREGKLAGQPYRLLPNRPARILMIPPEHRKDISPILKKLQTLFV